MATALYVFVESTDQFYAQRERAYFSSMSLLQQTMRVAKKQNIGVSVWQPVDWTLVESTELVSLNLCRSQKEQL
jgi:hypothetical protein